MEALTALEAASESTLKVGVTNPADAEGGQVVGSPPAQLLPAVEGEAGKAGAVGEDSCTALTAPCWVFLGLALSGAQASFLACAPPCSSWM